jgi:hypothetical protein
MPLTNCIKHKLLTGTIAGMGAASYYYATGHTLLPNDFHAMGMDLTSCAGAIEFARAFLVTYLPLTILRRYKLNEFVNFCKALPLHLKAISTTSDEEKLRIAEQEKAFMLEHHHLDLSTVEVLIRKGEYDAAMQMTKSYVQNKNIGRFERLLNNSNLFSYAVHGVKQLLGNTIRQPPPANDYEKRLLDVNDCLYADLWTLAKHTTQKALDQELPLFYRAYFTELMEVLQPQQAAFAWQKLAEQALQSPLEKRVEGDVWEVAEKGMREILKIRKDTEKNLQDTKTLAEYVATILDTSDVVMKPIMMVPREQDALLVYKHLDGSPLTYETGDACARANRSLAVLFARADHALLYEKDALNNGKSNTEYALFTLAQHLRHLPAEEQELILEAVLLLRDHDAKTRVFKRDSHRGNLLFNDCVIHIDIVNDGHTFLTDELAKFFYQGSALDDTIYAKTFFDVFNAEAEMKIPDREQFLLNIRSAALGRAMNYYGFTLDKPYRHDLARLFLQNASIALENVLSSYSGDEKVLLQDATALLKKYA